MTKEVIINLSQKGGSHMRPLMAFLNREIGEDFIAKSGNKCLKLSTLINWIDKQIQTPKDILKYYDGSNRHNHIRLTDLIPLNLNFRYEVMAVNKQSELCHIVWEQDISEVQLAMVALAQHVKNRLK